MNNELTDELWECTERLNRVIVAKNARIAELEAATRWIPVEERLPEDDERVLICYYETLMRYDGGWKFEKSKEASVTSAIFSVGQFYIGDECIDSATHWQPLPQPPEAQE